MADELRSGSRRNPVVRSTPIVSSASNHATSLFVLKIGQTGQPNVIRGRSGGRAGGCPANHLRRCRARTHSCASSAQCLGCFYTKSVEVELLRVLATFKQFR